MKKKIFIYNKETLGLEKPKKKTYIGILLTLGLLFMLGWLTGTNKYIINTITRFF